MAKIENYSNDTNITDNDRLFGTSVDGAISTTANFKASELKTFINSGYPTSSEVATDIATAKAEAIAAAATDTDNDVAAATSSITTAYQAYADQAEADAITTANTYTDTRETAITTAYQAYADTAEADAVVTARAYTNAAIEQKFALRSEEINIDGVSNATNDNIPIHFASLGSDPNGKTLKYDIDSNDNLSLVYNDDTGNDYIENEASVTVPVKISFSMFTSTGSSATKLTYRVEKSTDSGTTWTPVKTIIRSKSASSGGTTNNADSFFLYYGIDAGNLIKFTFKADHTNAILQAGSWIEVVAINPQT